MMFALKRLLILLLIVVVAYCFWPRSPSLTGFDPERISEIQVTVWKAASEKKIQGLLIPLYELYEGQFWLPPVSSLKMALDTTRALRIFYTAPDSADQEKAIVPLQTIYATLKSGTKAKFDSNAAAQMELMSWILRADHAKRAQLTTAWSEAIALVYGRSTEECLPAAKQFSIASKLADEGKWDEAKAASLEGWKVIKSLPAEQK